MSLAAPTAPLPYSSSPLYTNSGHGNMQSSSMLPLSCATCIECTVSGCGGAIASRVLFHEGQRGSSRGGGSGNGGGRGHPGARHTPPASLAAESCLCGMSAKGAPSAPPLMPPFNLQGALTFQVSLWFVLVMHHERRPPDVNQQFVKVSDRSLQSS